MRCAKHDLALGPDGQCIVCRRESAPPAPPEPSPSAGRWIVGTLAAVAAVTALGVAVRARTSVERIALSPDAPIAMPAAVIDGTATAPAAAPPPPETATAPAADPNAWRASIPSVRVLVYTTTWCPVCKRAKQWLGEHGYAYDERDIESSDVNRIECKALNPRLSIPTFDIDGDVMIGFSSADFVSKVERAAQKRAARVARGM